MDVGLWGRREAGEMMDELADRIAGVLPEVIELRRDLHAHPELSRQEYRTARRIREVLAGVAGLEVLPPLMETDVVAILNGDRSGRCIGLRADMDALPVAEMTDAAYKSTVSGVMHACGHDGHVAALVGTAKVLSQVADSLRGKVKFIFQPDEEDTGGGRVLCERGVLESPDVSAVIALHGWPSIPVGTIAIRSGPVMAASNPFSMTIRGQGAHGAYPHRSIDPVVIAAQIVTGLQTIVSRTVDPLDAAVVSVGRISAGSAVNVIPSECSLGGTMRYLKPTTGEHLRASLVRIAEHTARAHGADADVQILDGYPPMVNDADLTDLILSVGWDLFGAEYVIDDISPTMGVEDLAFYAQRVPTATFRLGLMPASRESYPGLHTPEFDFNDAALPIGIGMFCEITRRFLDRARAPG